MDLFVRLVSGSNLIRSRNGVIGMIHSRSQAGARPVSQPPAPASKPLPVMRYLIEI